MPKEKLAVKTVALTTPGGLFTSPSQATFLHAATLVDSLYQIKERSAEIHTQDNLQNLIDMILAARTTA